MGRKGSIATISTGWGNGRDARMLSFCVTRKNGNGGDALALEVWSGDQFLSSSPSITMSHHPLAPHTPPLVAVPVSFAMSVFELSSSVDL